MGNLPSCSIRAAPVCMISVSFLNFGKASQKKKKHFLLGIAQINPLPCMQLGQILYFCFCSTNKKCQRQFGQVGPPNLGNAQKKGRFFSGEASLRGGCDVIRIISEKEGRYLLLLFWWWWWFPFCCCWWWRLWWWRPKRCRRWWTRRWCRCSSDRGPNGGWRAATLNSTAARLHATHCDAACVIKRMQSAVHTEKTDGQTFCQDCIVKTGDSCSEVECIYFSNTHLLIIHIYAFCTTALC